MTYDAPKMVLAFSLISLVLQLLRVHPLDHAVLRLMFRLTIKDNAVWSKANCHLRRDDALVIEMFEPFRSANIDKFIADKCTSRKTTLSSFARFLSSCHL
ncbi:hypothetical protein BX666DRAFT_1359041 [Dichotomocladium elegans]|nr:hypothetical protein BX666DRAFT_1359041 [Dichotomocladium elegans]